MSFSLPKGSITFLPLGKEAPYWTKTKNPLHQEQGTVHKKTKLNKLCIKEKETFLDIF